MTQTSKFWGGTAIGDAGPYSYDEYNHPFHILLSDGRADAGVAVKFLNQLVGAVTAPAPIVPNVTINTGAALVRGIWYYSSALETHSITQITTPGNWERTDLIVLRANWTTQTVVQAVVEGATLYPLGDPNVSPALTQTDGVLWEIPLYEVNITSGEDVTIDDRRRFSIAQHFGKGLAATFLFQT